MKTLTLPAIMPHLVDSKVVLQFEIPVHIILQFIKFRSGHIYSQCYQITVNYMNTKACGRNAFQVEFDRLIGMAD
jgi:hypothetical protein